LIPLLNMDDTADPIEDYLAALRLLDEVAGDVDVLIPGHGSIAQGEQVRARIDQDRTYVLAVRDNREVRDSRFSAEYCRDWLPGVHAQQLESLAQRNARDKTSD
jgi:glyoxylase-like metal-dependent hydrolase (beta-lactamase superfamily II)